MHTPDNFELDCVYISIEEQFVVVDFISVDTGETVQVRRDIDIDVEDSSYDIFEAGRVVIDSIVERYTGRTPMKIH